MNADPVAEAPPRGLTPILAVSDAHAAIAFYAQAFGASEIARIAAPGTSRLMPCKNAGVWNSVRVHG
jgi:uncharacterized glyoxalase superfamily protein PhnB